MIVWMILKILKIMLKMNGRKKELKDLVGVWN